MSGWGVYDVIIEIILNIFQGFMVTWYLQKCLGTDRKKKDVYITGTVDTFLDMCIRDRGYGVVRPKVYISYAVNDEDVPYLYEHEYTHICHKHHIIKIITGIAAVIYLSLIHIYSTGNTSWR